jgi:hypothetical protein
MMRIKRQTPVNDFAIRQRRLAVNCPVVGRPADIHAGWPTAARKDPC